MAGQFQITLNSLVRMASGGVNDNMEALYNWKPDYSEVGKENIDKFLEENPKYYA